jgi:N-methylhydantoinase A
VNFSIAADIGGTFTDLVLAWPGGGLQVLKLPSTPADYSQAIGAGITRLLEQAGIGAAETGEVLHATTIASNTILEGKGARTGLITTRGFRDILELRTLRMPRLYDLTWDKPPVLVERRLRAEVTERIDFRGDIRVPLDEADVERAIARFREDAVESIAVCLLHSYANDAHERQIAAMLRDRMPGIPVSVSAEVLPEIREYERTSTTVINAYLVPVIAGYLARLHERLAELRLRAPLFVMQSNGGLVPADAALALPIHIAESGPAAGVVGALKLAARLGIADAISFDMGGTTAKVALIAAGEVSRAAEFQVGGGIMSGSRLLTGAGYTLKVPAIDLAEVGAGGGSVVWIDKAGQPQVGPESAGAVPGPACYGAGGTAPTITDCSLLLGYINPQAIAGGAVRLAPEQARVAVAQQIAAPLGLGVEDAAYGAVEVAVASMIRAIRAVSSERGRDPRGHALVAFGGNGGVFAGFVAAAMGFRQVVIPPLPGLFSAFGLLEADVEHYHARSLKRLLDELDPAELAAVIAALEERARDELAAEGFAAGIERMARLRYHGQSFELAVPLPDGAPDRAAIAALAEAFGARHEATYGHRAGADEPVELVTVGVVGRARRTGGARLAATAPGESGGMRRAYFGARHGWCDTPLLSRTDLQSPRRGPLIIEEYDGTIVVPPDFIASAVRQDCVLMARDMPVSRPREAFPRAME